MSRHQLFEFCDSRRIPTFLRESVVETLGTGLRWANMGSVIGPLFAEFQTEACCSTVLDLCCGTGEPAALLIDWLERQNGSIPHIVMSDLFPNPEQTARRVAAHPKHLESLSMPIDATAVAPDVVHEARTVMNAFHHFPPEIARDIFANAVDAGVSIFLYEGFERSVAGILPTLPALAASVLANPVTASRDRGVKALFTWLFPVIPALGAWDAVVSTLRVYTEAELRALVPADAPYRWTWRTRPYRLGGVATAFWGVPLALSS